MKKYINGIILTGLLIITCSCDAFLLGDVVSNDPESNFEVLWKEFDEKYGLFAPKGIDWDTLYSTYRPTVTSSSTDLELYTTLTTMLDNLNDSHVGLLPTAGSGLPRYQSGYLGTLTSMDDFVLDVVTDNYLSDKRFAEPYYTYGILDGTNIGYLHIEGFGEMPRKMDKPLDEILGYLGNTSGIIIDIRGGWGGEDLAGQYIAGRFTDQAYPYMRTRVKSGPEENDFTDWEDWTVSPEGNSQYLEPIVVLTHRFTISARETFALALKPRPNVTFIGDTTAGAFSNQINRELPNGWGYSLSIGQWTDAAGVFYEGVGLVPDTIVLNDSTDLLAGQDEALETAILSLP